MIPDFSAVRATGPQGCILGSKQPINACRFMRIYFRGDEEPRIVHVSWQLLAYTLLLGLSQLGHMLA